MGRTRIRWGRHDGEVGWLVERDGEPEGPLPMATIVERVAAEEARNGWTSPRRTARRAGAAAHTGARQHVQEHAEAYVRDGSTENLALLKAAIERAEKAFEAIDTSVRRAGDTGRPTRKAVPPHE